MNLLTKIIFCLILTLSLSTPRFNRVEAAGELDPKMKAFLLTSGYGAALGTLLGMATVAFGAPTRAIPQGASLGLYAGMLFGVYIIYSHDQKMGQEYRDAVTPYDETGLNYNPYGPRELVPGDAPFVGMRMAQMAKNQPRPWNISVNLLTIKF